MRLLLLMAVILLFVETPIHAYLDPGTGSLIYQTAIALVLGLGFAVRRGRTSIARFLRRLTGRKVDPDTDSAGN